MDCGWFVGHSWSLAFEEQFYLLFAILFAVSGRRIFYITGTVLIVFLSLPLVRFILGLGHWTGPIVEFTRPFLFICCGCIAAVRESELIALSQSRWATAISCTSIAIVALLVLSNGTEAFPAASAGSRLIALLDAVALPFSVAWLVVSSVYQKNAFTAFLSAPPVLFVGGISYSLYLWQQLFVAPLSLYLTPGIFVIWPLMFVFAWFSNRLVETPGIRIGKRIAVGRREARSA
jgi:peptidoglycan/LPS O-acetylase OafA/YrhL